MLENDTSLHSSPQLALVEQQGVAVVLAPKQVISLYKKSQYSEIPFDTLKEVYQRGYKESLSEQVAFNRVNSFIYGGKAAELDEDLNEKRGLWDNIHAKRERIKHGSGEHMRKPGSKGAPTAKDFRDSQNEGRVLPDLTQKPIEPQHSKEYAARMKDQKIKRAASEKERNDAKAFAMHMWAKRTRNESYTGAEKVSNNPNDASNRFVGTDALTANYKKATPGYLNTIKRVVKEHCGCKKEMEEDAKGYKNPTGGLTQKGRDHYNRTTGSNLKAPVTTPPSKLKAGSKSANRRKSFCARMGGVEGPMKKPNGEPTRKALALRKWNC